MNAARKAAICVPLRQPITRHGISVGAFSTSSRLGLKESSSQTDVDYDKHKKDSLDKQKKGTGHWKPELASDSEEAVRADQTAKEDFRTMQERTKKAAEESTRAGTSGGDGM
ncbi:hypothetical protein E4U41_006227 [Claviceps citrina]|nr:hypothetical protein E4U41_006227 [Claviceps citrina]